MARRKNPQASEDWLFPKATLGTSEDQSSLLDVVDSILNKGAVVNGDVILGVANVDLIYAKVSVLIAALDRIMKPAGAGRAGKAERKKGEGKRKSRR